MAASLVEQINYEAALADITTDIQNGGGQGRDLIGDAGAEGGRVRGAGGQCRLSNDR